MASSSLLCGSADSSSFELQQVLDQQQPTRRFSSAVTLVPLLARSMASAATETAKSAPYALSSATGGYLSCVSSLRSPFSSSAAATCSLLRAAQGTSISASLTTDVCGGSISPCVLPHASSSPVEGATPATHDQQQQVFPAPSSPSHLQQIVCSLRLQQHQQSAAGLSGSHYPTTAATAVVPLFETPHLRQETIAGAPGERYYHRGTHVYRACLAAGAKAGSAAGVIAAAAAKPTAIFAKTVDSAAASSDVNSCETRRTLLASTPALSELYIKEVPAVIIGAAIATDPAVAAAARAAAAAEFAAFINACTTDRKKMALTAASLRLRKRSRRLGAGAPAQKEEEAQQQQQRSTRRVRGRQEQKAPSSNSSVHASRRPSSSSSSRSRSRSAKRRIHSSSIRRSTRKVPASRRYDAAAGEAAAAAYHHNQEDWKKTGRRRLRGSSLAVGFNSSYTSSTRSSSITPINFVDMAYGSSSSSSREEALAATCREETPSSSSSGGASPSTCTDRSSSSSIESPGRSSRCSGREEEDEQLASGLSTSRLHLENHSAALHAEAAAAGPLTCPPPINAAAYPPSAEDKNPSHLMATTDSSRRVELGEPSGGGNHIATEGEEAGADDDETIGSSNRFTGQLLRKRGAAAAAGGGQGDLVTARMPCRTSGRRRRTTAAAAAARGEDSCWVYQEATASYSRGGRRSRGSAAVAAGAREGIVVPAGLGYNNSGATEKQMATATAEAAGEAVPACSSAYGYSVSSSSDLFCSSRESRQTRSSEVSSTAATAEKRGAAAMMTAADVGRLLPMEETSVVQRYAGSAATAAAAMHLFMRRSAPTTTGRAILHTAPAASCRINQEGTDTCAAGGMQDSSCCGAGESDAAGAGAQSASQQLLQYGGPGHQCTSNGMVTSEAELLQYGDALRQQGNGVSSSPTSAGAVSSAESSRTMCGVGRSHTCLPADSSCSSTDVLLHPPAASLHWNRTNSLSFNSNNSLSLGSNDSGSGLCGPCLDGRGEVASLSNGAVRRSSSSSNGASIAKSNRNNISFSSSSNSSEHCGSGSNTATSLARSSSTCGVVEGIGTSSAGGSSSADLLMRPGVSYYGGRQAWVAEIKYGGRRRFKVFSVAKYGYEGAKQMAAATREQWEAAREAGQLDQLMRSSQRHQCPVQSGVKGVYYDTARKGWRVVVTLNCRQMSKFFLASKFGNAEAKRLAIECRQMWLDAIRNGRADDVFEKARRLVSFKMKTTPPQLTSHSKLLSLSPVHKPVQSSLSLSPPSLTHCGNHATTTAGASLTTTNGLPSPSTLSGVTTGGAALSNAAAAAVANATLSQKATAAAAAGAAHVLLPPLVAAAAVSAPGAASSVSDMRNRISTFLMKSPAAATETGSSSRAHDKTGMAEEPLFSDAAAAAAARLAAAVAGVAAGQDQAASPAAAEAAAGFRDGCSSGLAAGGMLASATGMSQAMMTHDGCASVHAPAAEHRDVSAGTGGAAWLRGSNRNNNNVYETASQQQQHPSLLVHPLPTSCNELMLSNNSSGTTTACTSSGSASSHRSIKSGSSSISSIETRSDSALDSAKGSPDPTLNSFVACLAEDAGLHAPREEKQQDTDASHLRGKHPGCIGISCCTAAASAAAMTQKGPQTQKAAGETQKASAGIESIIASVATAVPEEAPTDASQTAQQFNCGEPTGQEAGKLVKSHATPAPGSALQQQQNQMEVPLAVTAGNVLSMRNAGVSQPFETTRGGGPLRQQKQWDDASGEESESAAATPGHSPAVAAAGEVKADRSAAAAVHGVAAGSAEGAGGQGASAQSAASTATAVEGGTAVAPATERGSDLGTAVQAIPKSGMKDIETLPRTTAGAPSGSRACGHNAVLFPLDVQAGISNNRQLQQHLQLQLLQDLRGSSFPLLDALWPSAAGSAPPVGSLAPNITPDLSLGGRVTGFSNCGTAAAAGKGKQGEGGSLLLPSIASGCLSGGNSYEVQNLSTAAVGFVAHGKAADAVAMLDSSAATVAEKASMRCGELPRGASVLSSLLQQPRAQLSLQQQQQFFASAAAASASRSSAVLNTAESGEGGQNGTDSNTQTACEAAAASAAGSSEICCRFPGGLASAAAAAALRPSNPWLLSSSQLCFVPGAAGVAATSTTAAGDTARCLLPVIGNMSNKAQLAGGSNTRRRGGGGSGGTVVTAAGAAPLSIQSRQPQMPQNAAAAASPLAAAAASRGRPPQQRQSKDGSGVTVTAAATAAGESSSTCDVRGVYLDTRNNAWAATMGVHGRNVKKSFAVAKHGYETALQLAIHARRQLERVYWGENPPGPNSSSNAPTPPSNSPPQPSSCLLITQVPIAAAGSVATSAAALTEGAEGDKNICFAAGSPSNSTPSAASALQLQRLQQQQQRLQQQVQQQLAATGGQSLPAAPSPPSLGIFGPRRDAALGPAGFAAAVMGGTSAAAAAGLVSAAAASLQQQLRCAAALQQQHQAHNAGAPTGEGLSLTQHQLCGWNTSPHALESATEEKGFYNSPGCRSSELAAAGGLGNMLLNAGNSVKTGQMLAEQPTTRDCVSTVNGNAGLPDAAAVLVATGGGAGVGRATAEAAARLAAANAILYPSLPTAPSAAPASPATSYGGCDTSSLPGAPVDGGRDGTHGGQEGCKTSAGCRLQHGRGGPNPCSNAGASTGDTSAASLLLGSAPAGARSNAGGTGGLLLGTVQGLAAAGGYEGAAENITGFNPTLLLNGYGVGAGPSGLLGGRGVEARRAAAAGAAAASFLAGTGGLLLGGGGGIAALLGGGRGSASAGEAGAIAAPSEGPAGESCFMMQDALTALLLQLEPRQRNDLLRGCPPHALLAAAAGAAAAASREESNTPSSLPVLLQQQYLHNSVGAQHRLLLQQAVASGASATGLLLEQQQQQIHYEQPQQEHSFDLQARQQQLLQQHPSQQQQQQQHMECMREDLQNNGSALRRPTDGGEHQLRTSSIGGRDADSSSTSLLPYDHSHQHAGLEEDAPSTETAMPLYVNAGHSSTSELWQSHQHSSRACKEVKAETVHHQQQQAGGGCASAVGTTEAPPAGTGGMINITGSFEDTAIRGNNSSNSFSSKTGGAARLNFPMIVPANTLSLRQEPAPNHGQSCSSMQQPCAPVSNVEREAKTAKGEETNSPYTWNEGVTLLETGLTLAAADAATTKDQEQQQPPTVASTYNGHAAAAASCASLLAEDNRRT